MISKIHFKTGKYDYKLHKIQSIRLKLCCKKISRILITLTLNFLCFFLSHFLNCVLSHSVTSDSSQPHEPQHTKPPCPSPTPRACSNLCPSRQWWHPTISSSVIPFYSGLQSFPASGSFPVSRFFTSGGQSIGISASASVLSIFRIFRTDFL